MPARIITTGWRLPAGFEGYKADELAMRLVGHFQAEIARKGTLAIDQDGRQHFASGSGQR